MDRGGVRWTHAAYAILPIEALEAGDGIFTRLAARG
jgi:hypothetical protein